MEKTKKMSSRIDPTFHSEGSEVMNVPRSSRSPLNDRTMRSMRVARNMRKTRMRLGLSRSLPSSSSVNPVTLKATMSASKRFQMSRQYSFSPRACALRISSTRKENVKKQLMLYVMSSNCSLAPSWSIIITTTFATTKDMTAASKYGFVTTLKEERTVQGAVAAGSGGARWGDSRRSMRRESTHSCCAAERKMEPEARPLACMNWFTTAATMRLVVKSAPKMMYATKYSA
mmetsp:Transcript_16767/g.36459  ORF Transcript_16767/g.36459 Transcript_16767/m.36459 type:complete len:230 (+) Transcript_16767:877-1566(+)